MWESKHTHRPGASRGRRHLYETEKEDLALRRGIVKSGETQARAETVRPP